MSDRDKFQGVCFENVNGALYMDMYDLLSLAVRRRLQRSPFNICTACFLLEIKLTGNNGFEVIKDFEERIRCEGVE